MLALRSLVRIGLAAGSLWLCGLDGAAQAAAEPEPLRAPGGDWPMWGGTSTRNMVNSATGVSIEFAPGDRKAKPQKLLWSAPLGSHSYGNPVVAGGRVFVGTNNAAGYRPKHKGDRGCVLCFDAATGKFLWQLTREKLPQGDATDWPEQGICSTPCVEGDRMWLVTNRCELMCLDPAGFLDGENDGPYKDEPDTEPQDADIVWSLDMMGKLGVQPHNMATSSPVVHGDLVFALTSNGVGEEHKRPAAPQAPSFLAVNKKTGAVVWQDNAPGERILHGQWSSPAIGVVNGQAQVYMPGGDGWLYAFAAETGKRLWKFDLNPKDSVWKLDGRGNRNSIVATPVFHQNSVVLAVGDDPEFGESVGHLYRIDATRTGDVSPVTPDNQPNPNSGQVWHLGGTDHDGSLTGKKDRDLFRRTLSTVAIHDGLVYAADASGRVHAVDFATGRRYWEADLLSPVWGSPLVVDGKILIGNEDGVVTVFAVGKELKKLHEIQFEASIYSTPTIAQGRILISDRSRLYAFSAQ